MESRSLKPLVTGADGAAASVADLALLLARLMIAALFLMIVWGGGPNSAYLKTLHYPAPGAMATLAHVVEWLVLISLVLGLATRYGALLGFVFVTIAFASAHRYWEYPQAAQAVQFVFLSKDLAIAGGLLAQFVAGPGRISVDAMLRR